MGLSILGGKSGCCCVPTKQLLDPDPKKFEILEAGINNDFTIIRIKYPDCTNYEGVKILVYKGHALKEIMAAKEIDPHFRDKHLSPIARFAPTDEGLALALNLTRQSPRQSSDRSEVSDK